MLAQNTFKTSIEASNILIFYIYSLIEFKWKINLEIIIKLRTCSKSIWKYGDDI